MEVFSGCRRLLAFKVHCMLLSWPVGPVVVLSQLWSHWRLCSVCWAGRCQAFIILAEGLWHWIWTLKGPRSAALDSVGLLEALQWCSGGAPGWPQHQLEICPDTTELLTWLELWKEDIAVQVVWFGDGLLPLLWRRWWPLLRCSGRRGGRSEETVVSKWATRRLTRVLGAPSHQNGGLFLFVFSLHCSFKWLWGMLTYPPPPPAPNCMSKERLVKDRKCFIQFLQMVLKQSGSDKWKLKWVHDISTLFSVPSS